MTTFVFANNINTTLAGSISPSATSMTLSSTANLPSSIPSGSTLVLTLNDAATETNFEIVYVTAIAGATVTMTRAQEGTAAQAWTTGDFVYSGPTAGQMANFPQGGSSGVTPGSYGDSTHVAQFTVSATGQITAAASVAIAFPITSFNGRAGAITLNSGDVTTALGFTPVNKAGDTMTGALVTTGLTTISASTANNLFMAYSGSSAHQFYLASSATGFSINATDGSGAFSQQAFVISLDGTSTTFNNAIDVQQMVVGNALGLIYETASGNGVLGFRSGTGASSKFFSMDASGNFNAASGGGNFAGTVTAHAFNTTP